MSRHASLEVLAIYVEGALKPRKAKRVTSHLAGCSKCSGNMQDLQQIPAMLASVHYPQIPDTLTVRIELAISSESATRVATGPVSAEAGRRDLPDRARRPRRRGWQVPGFSSPLVGSLAAVGAAVVIAGGGYAITSNLGSPGGSSTSSSGHQAPAPAAVNSGNAAASAGSAVGYGPEVPVRHDGKTSLVQSVHTSTNFQPGKLSAQAQQALRISHASNVNSEQQQLSSPNAQNVNAGQLKGCVSKVAAGRNVLLVDIAKYQGKQATIIVTGTPNGPGTVYAVGSACSGSNPDILAKQHVPHLSP